LADVGEAIHISRPEYETSAELKRVLPQFVLLMASGTRSLSCLGVVLAKEMKKIRGFQLDRVVGLSSFVNKKRKRDARFLAKLLGVDYIPQTDRRESRAPIAELLLMRAQLRGVLTAEDSPIVA
jgi:hypothetical protein